MKKYIAVTAFFTLILLTFLSITAPVSAQVVDISSNSSDSSSTPVTVGDNSITNTIVASSTVVAPTQSNSNSDVVASTTSAGTSLNGTNNSGNADGSASTTGANDNGGTSGTPIVSSGNGSGSSDGIPNLNGSNDSGSISTTSASTTTATSTASTTTTTTATNSTSGGGSSTGNVQFSGGGGGGSYALSSFGTSASTASSSVIAGALSCPLLNGYVIQGQRNSPTEITKLQVFLNTYEHDSAVTATGVLDQATISGILAFQQKYLSQIMGPWGSHSPSGNVYITTQHEINSIVCGPQPSLTSAEQAIINHYLATVAANAASAASVNNSTIANTVTTTNGSTTATTSDSSTASTTGNNSVLTGSVVSTGAGNFFGNIFSKIFGFFGVK